MRQTLLVVVVVNGDINILIDIKGIQFKKSNLLFIFLFIKLILSNLYGGIELYLYFIYVNGSVGVLV